MNLCISVVFVFGADCALIGRSKIGSTVILDPVRDPGDAGRRSIEKESQAIAYMSRVDARDKTRILAKDIGGCSFYGRKGRFRDGLTDLSELQEEFDEWVEGYA